jgi:hypothetical protein
MYLNVFKIRIGLFQRRVKRNFEHVHVLWGEQLTLTAYLSGDPQKILQFQDLHGQSNDPRFIRQV